MKSRFDTIVVSLFKPLPHTERCVQKLYFPSETFSVAYLMFNTLGFNTLEKAKYFCI